MKTFNGKNPPPVIIIRRCTTCYACIKLIICCIIYCPCSICNDYFSSKWLSFCCWWCHSSSSPSCLILGRRSSTSTSDTVYDVNHLVNVGYLSILNSDKLLVYVVYLLLFLWT